MVDIGAELGESGIGEGTDGTGGNADVRLTHFHRHIDVAELRGKYQILIVAHTHAYHVLLERIDPVDEVRVIGDGIQILLNLLDLGIHSGGTVVGYLTGGTLALIQVGDEILRVVDAHLVRGDARINVDGIAGEDTELVRGTVDSGGFQRKYQIGLICVRIGKDITALPFSGFERLSTAIEIDLNGCEAVASAGACEIVHLCRLIDADLIGFVHGDRAVKAQVALGGIVGGGIVSIHGNVELFVVFGAFLVQKHQSGVGLRAAEF